MTSDEKYHHERDSQTGYMAWKWVCFLFFSKLTLSSNRIVFLKDLEMSTSYIIQKGIKSI